MSNTTLAAELVKDRTKGLGGTDMGPLVLGPERCFGKTPLSVYREKIGEAPPFEASEAMHWGNVLEDPVAQEYVARTGRKVRRVNETLRDKDRPYLMAHIDRKVVGEDRILEVKTTGRDWARDELPDNYTVQVQHYLGVTGAAVADVAVLVGGQKFHLYEIPRNDELIEILQGAGEKFWNTHVLPRLPPEPQSADDCALLWAKHTEGKTVEASGEIIDMLRTLAQARDSSAWAKEKAAAVELDLKRLMQTAESIVSPSGDVLLTWKEQMRTTVAVKDMPKDLREEYSREASHRVFRPKWKKLEAMVDGK